MKPKEFKVKYLEDFQQMVDQKHFGISEAVVSAILSNLKTRKKHLNQRVDWLEEQIEIMGNVVHNREKNQRDKIRKEVNLYLEELKND